MSTADESDDSVENTPKDASVLEAAEQFTLVRFRATQYVDDRESRATASGTRTVYVDIVVPRVREEERGEVINQILDYSYSAVYDYSRDRFLTLLSQELRVVKDQVTDEAQRHHTRLVEEEGLARKKAVLSNIARTRTDGIPPMSLVGKNCGFLDSLRLIQADNDTLTTLEELDGREVLKHQLREMEGNVTTSLWVDLQTNLPIRVEIEMIDPTPRIARNSWAYTDFEWDPQVADPVTLFNTDPPAGYAVEDHLTGS